MARMRSRSILRPIEPIALGPGISMSFQVIPPVGVQEAAVAEGKPLSFLMGARGYEPEEEPRHQVIIPKPFYLGTYPVTQEEFAVWTESEEYVHWLGTHSHPLEDWRPHRNEISGSGWLPAENLNWNEARAFMEWFNDSGRLPDGLTARLPSEAEWEYACRAGSDTEFWNGDGEAALAEVGWYRKVKLGARTKGVGWNKARNSWGLSDMHGNVFEWCEDVYDDCAYSRRGTPWVARAWNLSDCGIAQEKAVRDAAHVIRGGSWVAGSTRCRSAVRSWRQREARSGQVGFRVLMCLREVV
jgi:formylglycine-generating enzyme required for sulfatase activity